MYLTILLRRHAILPLFGSIQHRSMHENNIRFKVHEESLGFDDSENTRPAPVGGLSALFGTAMRAQMSSTNSDFAD